MIQKSTRTAIRKLENELELSTQSHLKPAVTANFNLIPQLQENSTILRVQENNSQFQISIATSTQHQYNITVPLVSTNRNLANKNEISQEEAQISINATNQPQSLQSSLTTTAISNIIQSTSEQVYNYKMHIITNKDLYRQTQSIPIQLIFFNARMRQLHKTLRSNNISPNKQLMIYYYKNRTNAKPVLPPRQTSTLPQLIHHDLQLVGISLNDIQSFYDLERCANNRKQWLKLVQSIRKQYIRQLSEDGIYEAPKTDIQTMTDNDYMFTAQMRSAQDATSIQDQDLSFTSETLETQIAETSKQVIVPDSPNITTIIVSEGSTSRTTIPAPTLTDQIVHTNITSNNAIINNNTTMLNNNNEPEDSRILITLTTKSLKMNAEPIKRATMETESNPNNTTNINNEQYNGIKKRSRSGPKQRRRKRQDINSENSTTCTTDQDRTSSVREEESIFNNTKRMK